MLKKIPAILAALTTTLHMATAQTTFTSLEEMWKYADVHNTAIRNAHYELDKTAAAKKQSYAAFLPQVNATAAFTNNLNLQTTLVPAIIVNPKAAAGEVVPVQFGQKYIYQAGITAQLDILNLQTWYNVRITEETEGLNKANLANISKGIYQQLGAQYYAYLLMKEAEKLAVRSSGITDSVYVSVQHKFDEGTINESNLDLAKINKARAEQTLVSAQFQVKTILNNIKNLLDLSLSDSLAINATLTKNDVEIGSVFAEDPSVQQAYYQSKIAISRFKASKANFAPTVSIAYSGTGQLNDNKFEPFQSGGPTWYPASFWSLRANWNIFTGGTRWLQAKQNKINEYESSMQYEAVVKQAAINDDNLRLTYSKTQLLLEKSERIMLLSFDNYKHMSERYEAGIATLDDRLNSFSDYINYQNQYLNSLSDALVQTYLMKIRLVANAKER